MARESLLRDHGGGEPLCESMKVKPGLCCRLQDVGDHFGSWDACGVPKMSA